jgi:hypothetical protein
VAVFINFFSSSSSVERPNKLVLKSGLTCKCKTRLERLARNMNGNLFYPVITGEEKSFNID